MPKKTPLGIELEPGWSVTPVDQLMEVIAIGSQVGILRPGQDLIAAVVEKISIDENGAAYLCHWFDGFTKHEGWFYRGSLTTDNASFRKIGFSNLTEV